MKRSWREKSRQALAILLTMALLLGTWGTSAGAAVLESALPEQEAILEETPEAAPDTDTAGSTEEQPEETPGDSGEIGETPEEGPKTDLTDPAGEADSTSEEPEISETPEAPSEETPGETPEAQPEETPDTQEDLNAEAEEIAEEPSEEPSANAEEIVGDPEPMAGALESARLDITQYLAIYPAANKNYRWNTNGTGKNACVHLDEYNGRDCTMKFEQVTSGGVYYYSIRYSGSGYFIDSEKDDSKTGRVLHNGKTSRNQDNQLFRFVPVKDSRGNIKKNTYYILSKKGDNEKKSLYIGLDKDQDIAYKRKVATSSKPMEWVVENAAVPVPSGAQKLPENTADHRTICMIYPKGYKRDVNVDGDSGRNGAGLHLYLHGTSSKFECTWNSTYQAYKLGCMTITEKSLGTVWEVDGRRYENGTAIHAWEKVSDSLSQYWRFISRGNGVYRIQNAYTGKYASLKEIKDDDNVDLVISSTPMDWQVDVINVSDQDARAVKWMSEIPDSTHLSDLNIPASHDTGTAWTSAYGMNTSEHESTSFSKCQQLFVEEQLNVGVRAFDLRVYQKDATDDPDIVHGDQYGQCRKQDFSKLTMKDVLQKTTDFLRVNPSETVIIKVGAQGSGGGPENVARAIELCIQNDDYPIYKPDTYAVPTLGEVRGKIVLMRAFSFGSYEPSVKESYFGPDVASGWGKDYDQIPGARQIYDRDGCQIWVQDAYKVNTTDKRSHVEKTIAQANGGEIPGGSYIWNFTSCTDPSIIIKSARNMTNWFLSRAAREYRSGKKLGIMPMDYIDAKMALAIYDAPPVETVTFPSQVTMTYGQSLSQATLKGGSALGSFSFKTPNTKPSKAGTHVYRMVYTLDPSEPPIEQDVTVTVGKAAQKLKSSFKNLKRQVGAASVTQKISGANTRLTFTSSNKKVARVDKNGRIRFVGVGKTVITIRAAESENYKAASKKFTVTVIPKTIGVQDLASPKKGNIRFKLKNASKTYTGYEIQYRVNKSKKLQTRKLKGGAFKKATLNKFKSGDVIRLRIRAYQKVGGKIYYGKYGKTRTIKVK